MKISTLGLALTTAVLALSVQLPAASAASEEPDPGSVAIGNGLFRSYCASCHGRGAKGDGQISEYLTVKPSDLTKIAANNDGEFDRARVVRIIDGREKVKGHSGKDMPVWGDAFHNTGGEMSEEEVAKRITHLAAYLESIQE